MLITVEGPESHSQISNVPSTSRRIVSNASIADPNQDSAGGARVWASNEKASDIFANVFTSHVVGRVWPGGVPLDWVRGRDGVTTLAWSSSAQEGILTMNKSPVAARTDGSLQIEVHDPEGVGGRMFWSRQYYVVPLEVLSLSHTHIHTLSFAPNSITITYCRRNDTTVKQEKTRKPPEK